ncbi:MAG: hypothetical protein V1861_01715, partial [Candidatus Micrarchaeota archaeon]
MNWQKRLVGTVSGRMGFPIIDGAHPYFRKPQLDEPILLTQKKPGQPAARSSEPTRELDTGDLEILEEAAPGASPALPRASEPTTEISTSDLLEIDGKRVLQLPPPPRISVRPPPAPSTLPPAGAEPARTSEESGDYSLEDLLSAHKDRIANDGTDGKGAARDTSSSVIASMEEIQ